MVINAIQHTDAIEGEKFGEKCYRELQLPSSTTAQILSGNVIATIFILFYLYSKFIWDSVPILTMITI